MLPGLWFLDAAAWLEVEWLRAWGAAVLRPYMFSVAAGRSAGILGASDLVHFPEVDACGLGWGIDGGDGCAGFQVDDFYGAGFAAHAFDGDEGVAAVGSDGDTVEDFAFSRDACEFFRGVGREDRHGGIAFVGRDQQTAVGRHAKVVDTVPGRNSSNELPCFRIYFDDLIRLIAGDVDAGRVNAGLCPCGAAGCRRHRHIHAGVWI